jgi:hypothetical protein
MKALIFDLDGTLVDSVYAHVLAWQLAFAEAGIPIDGWRLHRRMGMSGGLFKRAVMRELGRTISMPRLKSLDNATANCSDNSCPSPVRCPVQSNCSGSCVGTRSSTALPLPTNGPTSTPP